MNGWKALLVSAALSCTTAFAAEKKDPAPGPRPIDSFFVGDKFTKNFEAFFSMFPDAKDGDLIMNRKAAAKWVDDTWPLMADYVAAMPPEGAAGLNLAFRRFRSFPESLAVTVDLFDSVSMAHAHMSLLAAAIVTSDPQKGKLVGEVGKKLLDQRRKLADHMIVLSMAADRALVERPFKR